MRLFKDLNVEFEDALFVDLSDGHPVNGMSKVNDPQVPNGSPPVPSRPFLNQRFAIPLAAAVIGIAALLIFMWRRSSR